MTLWQPLLELLSWYPTFKTSHCKLFEDRASLVFIYRWPIFKWVISLRQKWNRRHLADIFKCIFLNEKILISIKLSLKFIRNGPINNIQALVQIMAWRRPGDNPLSEPMAHMSHSASMSSRDWIHDSIRVSEWLSFNGLSWTADSDVHVVHISRVIIDYTRIVAIAMNASPQAPLKCDSKSFKIIGHKIWNGPSFATDKRLAEPALS